MTRPPTVAEARAALWAARASWMVRSQLRRPGTLEAQLPAPPRLPATAVRGVTGVLRRANARCLVQAWVLQSWYGAQGEPHDVVVGVTKPSEGFKAHAWLDGQHGCADGTFHELMRRPYRPPTSPSLPRATR